MASVFLGRLSGMAGFQKFVAIKIIHPHLVAKEDFVDMFLDEARLSASIHHPNVVEIFEVGEVDGIFFMVAELVRGRSLRDLLRAANRARRRLEPRLFLTIMSRVCDALDAAHTLKAADGSSLGVVHRDISPTNILISFDGFVKLIDFGIAFSKERITKTEAGIVKGKLDFMAPEQFRGETADRRNDIFSIGILLYLLATGRHPFSGRDESERLEKLIVCNPTSPRKIHPDVDPHLESIINKALSKNPDDRHQTTKELGHDLRNLLHPKGVLVDQQEIADFLSQILATEIAEDQETFAQAIAMSPASEDDFGSSGNIIVRNHQFFETKPPKKPHAVPQTEVIAPTTKPPTVVPQTEVIAPPYTPPENPRKHRRLIFAFVLVAAFLVVVLMKQPFWNRTQQEETRPTVSVKKGLETDAKATMASGAMLLTGDIRKPEVRQPKAEPIETKEVLGTDAKATMASGAQQVANKGREPQVAQPKAKPIEASFKILLKNLPDSAEVKLDGNDAPVVAGQITVPADGAKRKLQVTAEGYWPYLRKIKPTKDGAITVKLQKKRTPPLKKVHNTQKKPKSEPNHKLQKCPYQECPY